VCGMKARAERIFPKGFDPVVNTIEVKGDIITSGGRGKIKHDFRDVTGYIDNIKDAIIRKCEAIITFIKGDELWKLQKTKKESVLQLPVSRDCLMGLYALGTDALALRSPRRETLNLTSRSVLKI